METLRHERLRRVSKYEDPAGKKELKPGWDILTYCMTGIWKISVRLKRENFTSFQALPVPLSQVGC